MVLAPRLVTLGALGWIRAWGDAPPNRHGSALNVMDTSIAGSGTSYTGHGPSKLIWFRVPDPLGGEAPLTKVTKCYILHILSRLGLHIHLWEGKSKCLGNKSVRPFHPC